MKDWYDSMIEYERGHGEVYGINSVGGLVELFDMGTCRTVARFTVEQVSIFFEGLNSYQEVFLKQDVMSKRINEMIDAIESRHVDWEPLHNNMTAKEVYCYLRQCMKVNGITFYPTV